jgi:hypothetical protein
MSDSNYGVIVALHHCTDCVQVLGTKRLTKTQYFTQIGSDTYPGVHSCYALGTRACPMRNAAERTLGSAV